MYRNKKMFAYDTHVHACIIIEGNKSHKTFIKPANIYMFNIDNLHYRLISDLGKSRQRKRNSGKNLIGTKVVKSQNWSQNVVVKYGKYSPAKFANFLCFCITCGNCYHF